MLIDEKKNENVCPMRCSQYQRNIIYNCITFLCFNDSDSATSFAFLVISSTENEKLGYHVSHLNEIIKNPTYVEYAAYELSPCRHIQVQ